MEYRDLAGVLLDAFGVAITFVKIKGLFASAAADWQLCPGTAEPNVEDDTSYDTDGWGENTQTGQD